MNTLEKGKVIKKESQDFNIKFFEDQKPSWNNWNF